MIKNTITKNNLNNTVNNTSNQEKTSVEWKIVIPKINLDAPIAEGTTTDVMDKFVGHFVGTPYIVGNVCLAAHNRGYPVNYFQRIKELEEGDVIQYIFGNNRKQYEVKTITIISDTNWTYLENTNDNRITLITCVENQPSYRRCIQAREIK